MGAQHRGTDDLDLEIGSGGEEDFAADGESVDDGCSFDGVAGDGIRCAGSCEDKGGLGGGKRLDDAEDLVAANGLAGVVDVDDPGVEGSVCAVGVGEVGEVENEAWKGVFVGGLLGEENGALDAGSGRDDEFAGVAGDVFALFAEWVGDDAFDRVAGAGAVAVDRAGEANAEGEAGSEVGASGSGDAGLDGAWHFAVGDVEELKEGGEEAAGCAVFDEEGLDFEVGRVEKVVERGVVVAVFVVDVDALLDKGVGDLLVGDEDFVVGGVAGAEDGPVEGGATVGVGGFDVSARSEKLLGFIQAVKRVIGPGFAGGLVELLDERRGFGDVELYGGWGELLVFGVPSSSASGFAGWVWGDAGVWRGSRAG